MKTNTMETVEVQVHFRNTTVQKKSSAITAELGRYYAEQISTKTLGVSRAEQSATADFIPRGQTDRINLSGNERHASNRKEPVSFPQRTMYPKHN